MEGESLLSGQYCVIAPEPVYPDITSSGHHLEMKVIRTLPHPATAAYIHTVSRVVYVITFVTGVFRRGVC